LSPRSWLTAVRAFGEVLAKFLVPTPNSLMGGGNTPLGQQELSVSQADAEHVIQPDNMADDLGGKTMAIVRVGRGFHPVSLTGMQSHRQTRLP
jgi:hypothetical protein